MIVLYSSGSYGDFGKRSEDFTAGYSFYNDETTVRATKSEPRTTRLIIEYRVDDDVRPYYDKGGIYRFPKGVVYQVVSMNKARLVLSVSRKPKTKQTKGLTINEKIFDAIVQRKIGLLSLAGGVSDEAFRELSKSNDALRERVLGGLSDFTFSQANMKKMETVISYVLETRIKAWNNTYAKIYARLEETSKGEIDWSYGMLLGLIPVAVSLKKPKKSFIDGILISGKWDGRTLREWINQIRSEDLRKIEGGIRAGVAMNQTASSIAKGIFGKEGVLNATGRAIETVVRSAMSFFTGQARNETYKENEDIFSYERYTAVLDGRTSALCRGLDGNIYKVGEGAIPPMHPNCRSVRIPVLKATAMGKMSLKDAEEAIHVRAYSKENGLGDISRREDLPHGHKQAFGEYSRARLLNDIGNTPAVPNYSEWLARQPQSFVEGILGVKRARLFLEGGITLDKHVSFTGNIYTLDQLNNKFNI